MTDDDILATADRLPSGARFFLCALQVNPSSYEGAYQGRQSAVDPASHAKAIIERASDLRVSAVAITDHNSVDGVAVFRDAAASTNIAILPGFELSSSEGVHVLCIYPPDASELQLGRYLGEFGIRRTGPSTDLSAMSLDQILAKVPEQGGVAVAAHATASKGLFKVLDGQARVSAWSDPNLLSIQIPGPVSDLPTDVRRIVENRDANYVREHLASERQGVAVVNAKDVKNAVDLGDPSATCWIKMSEVTVEGLRQAFLDPDSRIRLNSSSEPEPHAELVSLVWEGGFLRDTAIHFNQNLNVLLGGRGSGKSTVIESIRYVLDLDPIGEQARAAHRGVVSGVLRAGTRLSLRLRVSRPAAREYTIQRTVPNPPVVRDEQGQLLEIRPTDLLPGIEVYGQHEVAELTRSGEKLTALLRRFVPRDETLDRRKADVRRGLERTRRALLDVDAELAMLDERTASLPALEDTLRSYREAGLEDRLSEQSLLVREERILESLPERTRPVRDFLTNLQNELPIDRTFLSDAALDGLPGKEIIADLRGILDELGDELELSAAAISAALARADDAIRGVRERWDDRKREVERTYESILRDLDKSAVDAEEFIRLRREIEILQPLHDRWPLLERIRGEHLRSRRELLAEWEELTTREFMLLSEAAGQINSRLRGHVRVAVTPTGELEPLFAVLREEIGGQLSRVIDALRQARDFSLPEFVDRCRQGAEAVRERYGFTAAQAGRLVGATPEALMRIEELDLPPTTSIELNIGDGIEQPVWQTLGQLSTGQKATAVLLLLLLESDAPLVIDQPEDDLDNRFITEGVVPRIREEKRRRQFVFATHNANIPVLGDAELILGLTPSGEAGLESGSATIRGEHMGSIDEPAVRSLIEDILEGGRDAFETRRLKYGF